MHSYVDKKTNAIPTSRRTERAAASSHHRSRDSLYRGDALRLSSMTPSRIMQLQQTWGNRATIQLMKNQTAAQRMIADEEKSSLYVSEDWPNLTNLDEVPVHHALTLNKSKFNETAQDRIASAYDINAWNDTIHYQNKDMLARFHSAFGKAIASDQDLLLNALKYAWEQQHQDDESDVETFMNKMKDADMKTRMKSLIELKPDFKHLNQAITRFIDLEHYLLDWNDMQIDSLNTDELFQNMVSRAKPVLLPSDYLEDDNQSDVDFDLDESGNIPNDKKTKVCALIAMIYQKSASAGNSQLAKAKVSDLMNTFGLNIPPNSLTTQEKVGKHLPNNSTLYDKLTNQLHQVLHEEGTLYDLDRYSEQLLMRAGYKRIVACRCSFADLPKNIPAHITLHQGQTYIFHIEGHALAMLMKDNVEGKLGTMNPEPLDSIRDYFEPLNETAKNYNLDSLTKMVSAIWQE